jgi:ribonucleotide reductase alpha subunit
VFEYGINDDDSLGVNIYSSKTGAWIFKESKRGEGIVLSTYGKSVFVNGFMHILEFTQIVVVDMEGKT